MDAGAALLRLAKLSGGTVQQVGPRSFVLSRKIEPARQLRSATPRALAPKLVIPVAAAPVHSAIVVTASKRDTRLNRFPGQWSRIGGEAFGPLGVAGSEAIEARSDGFSSTHLGAGRNKLFIRGIADSSFSGPTQSPVGQYIGDT